jgi:hypothetical protein
MCRLTLTPASDYSLEQESLALMVFDNQNR